MQDALDEANERRRLGRFNENFNAFEWLPEPVVIELDPEHGWTAFQAAQRDWSKQ
jgi:hypothetical protein